MEKKNNNNYNNNRHRSNNSSFIEHLKKGEFRVPVCISCKKKSWPPSHTCSKCFASTLLKRAPKVGTLIEFSTSDVRGHEGVFGIIEMEGGIRLIGSFDKESKLSKDMVVRMDKCGVTPEGTPFYHFVSAK